MTSHYLSGNPTVPQCGEVNTIALPGGYVSTRALKTAVWFSKEGDNLRFHFFCSLVRQRVPETNLEEAIQPALVNCHLLHTGAVVVAQFDAEVRPLPNTPAVSQTC